MAYAGPFKANNQPVAALASGAGTQGTFRSAFTGAAAGGGGTAKITNTGAVAVFILFYNFATAGGDPTLVFPATGTLAPITTAIPADGRYVCGMVPPSTSASTYIDGVSNFDSFAVITAASAATVVVQKGEGNGP